MEARRRPLYWPGTWVGQEKASNGGWNLVRVQRVFFLLPLFFVCVKPSARGLIRKKKKKKREYIKQGLNHNDEEFLDGFYYACFFQ